MSFSVSTGYFLAIAITSFAICYQHGPLTTELSITLFTWMLQLTAFVLIYCGVTIPQVAYAVMAVSLCSKGLCYPLGAACHIARSVHQFVNVQVLGAPGNIEADNEKGPCTSVMI